MTHCSRLTTERHLEGGWTGRRFQVGTNKELLDAEVFAIWQALRVLE